MKPLIMITNDDGIHSPGLLACVEAVRDLGEILISAPIGQQTGMARAFPRTKDLGIIETVPFIFADKTIQGYGIHGSPAYAVAHGVMELADRKPDLCISGINYGENLGKVLSCSGTVGAILEADSHEIPGIAFSRQVELKYQRTKEYRALEWDVLKEIVRYWTIRVLKNKMPKGATMLNINIPNGVKDVETYRYTRQSRQNYFEFIKPGKREFSTAFELKSQMLIDRQSLERDSDIYAVYIDKITSVTPLSWDMSVAEVPPEEKVCPGSWLHS